MAGQGSFYHGVTVTLIDSGARTIALPSSSIIGLVDTYTPADGLVAPNIPVLVTGKGDAAKKFGPASAICKRMNEIFDQAGAVVVAVGVDVATAGAELTSAIIGGIATLDGQPVTVIGIRKGHTTKENIRCNFGMPSPEGYKKALRLMKQAEKFGRAVIAFVDTPGAFCGLEAEERGQGEAIARNLLEMSDLKVPVLSVVIGEGGSGGALALAVGNEVWMMENATYTILSPEGFASILWKDSRKAPEAAEVMKVTAAHLKELGIIERIIPEEYPASEENLPEIAEYMKIRMKQFLEKQTGKSGLQIAQERYERFRKM